jgi:hypothetical protein
MAELLELARGLASQVVADTGASVATRSSAQSFFDRLSSDALNDTQAE